MSNYPPGVTGNEPEIAGYPSMTLDKQCEEDVPYIATWVVTEHLDGIAAVIARSDDTIPAIIEQLGHLWEHLNKDAVDVTCGFDGDVDAEMAYGVAYWTCPRCGTEHEDSYDEEDFGPDPDRERF